GVIRDASLFAFIRDNLVKIEALEPATLVELLERNVRIKAAVVMEDEKEAGVRAHLNFGHTFAHAIEATTGYGEIEHGEAVSLGMVAATTLAVDLGMCDTDVLKQLVALLEAIGLPVRAELPETERLLHVMTLDKKVSRNKVRFVLPERLGSVTMRDDIPLDQVTVAWDAIRAKREAV
ncbi:MAG: hypothetical protein WD079_06020, partial [Phycisphaeraceae bacterium]